MAINVHLGGKVYPHSDSSFGANYINPHEKRTQEVVAGLVQEVSRLKKDVEDLKGQVSKNKSNIHQLNASVIDEKKKIEGSVASLSRRVDAESTRSRLGIYDLGVRCDGLEDNVRILNQVVFNPMHYTGGY